MDLIELRILAAAGLLAAGVVVSTLAVWAVAVAEWVDRRLRARETRLAGHSIGGHPHLGSGRARC